MGLVNAMFSVNDIQNGWRQLTLPGASTWQRLGGAGEVFVNVVIDVSMLFAVGEAVRTAVIGAKAAWGLETTVNLVDKGTGNSQLEFNLQRFASKKLGPYNWGDSSSLNQHFADHGQDFGAQNPNEYAKMANEFSNAKNNYLVKVDSKGVTRVYDPQTNTFGSYNSDGTTRTFYKPTSPTYWQRQPGQ